MTYNYELRRKINLKVRCKKVTGLCKVAMKCYPEKHPLEIYDVISFDAWHVWDGD